MARVGRLRAVAAAALLTVTVACGGRGAPGVASGSPAAPAVTETQRPSPSPLPSPSATASVAPAATSTQAPVATVVIVAATPQPTRQPDVESVRFAVIGDFGLAGGGEWLVAQLVKSWAPDFILTVGDNNYPSGAQSTIDKNIGQYYASYIYPYTGTYAVTTTISINRFFPTLGNHDWGARGARPYLDYFTLHGNERYYDFVRGPAHFFALDSDSREPDGNTSQSKQAAWLRDAMTGSTACWQIVYFHHAPYSSAWHGSYKPMQWPFKEWGADIVMAGHDHTYERLEVDGLAYFVNGLGGGAIYNFEDPLDGSQVRYNAHRGAMRVTVTRNALRVEFVNVDGEVVDSYEFAGGCG